MFFFFDNFWFFWFFVLFEELGVGKSATDCFVSVSGPSNQGNIEMCFNLCVCVWLTLNRVWRSSDEREQPRRAEQCGVARGKRMVLLCVRCCGLLTCGVVQTSAWSSAAFQLRVTLAAIDTKRAAVVQPTVKSMFTTRRRTSHVLKHFFVVFCCTPPLQKKRRQSIATPTQPTCGCHRVTWISLAIVRPMNRSCWCAANSVVRSVFSCFFRFFFVKWYAHLLVV